MHRLSHLTLNYCDMVLMRNALSKWFGCVFTSELVSLFRFNLLHVAAGKLRLDD